MEQILTAEEIFGIGVEIERNGKAFYEAAAAGASGAGIKELLNMLSAWETKHIELFSRLLESIPAEIRNQNLYDPENEIALYVKATADNHIFVKNSNTGELVASCKTPVDILTMALSFEKDSVVFYASMREVVGERQGRDEVDRLIHEELMHISFITREMQKIKV